MGWDCGGRGAVGRWREGRRKLKERKKGKEIGGSQARVDNGEEGVEMQEVEKSAGTTGAQQEAGGSLQQRSADALAGNDDIQKDIERQEIVAIAKDKESTTNLENEADVGKPAAWNKEGGTDMLAHAIPVKVGIAIIVSFFSMSFSSNLISRVPRC